MQSLQGRDHQRRAHDDKRDAKRILAADAIAIAAEKQRAERADDEADGEGGEIRDERKRVIDAGITQRRNDHGETSENVKVVPLDDGPNTGGGDDSPDLTAID